MTDYGPSDTSTTTLDGQTTQFPISDVYVPNVGLTAVEGGPVSTDGANKKSAPMGVYVKDGNDLTQGLTTDASVTGDNAGTISAKLRGQLKIFTDVWDSVNHLFHFNLKQVAGAAISLANPIPVQSQRLEISGLSAGPGSGGNLTLLSLTDVSNFKWFSIDVQGTFSGNVKFWTSNQNPGSPPTGMTLTLVQRADGANTLAQLATQVSIAGLFGGVLPGRYLYIDVEPLTSGTVTATVELYATPPPWALTVAQILPSNNFIGFMGVGGKNNLRIAAGTATDTLIKNGNGAPSYIGTIIVNASGTNQLDIYDAVPINPIPSSNPIMASVPANAAPGPYVFNSYCQFGIACKGNANNPGFSISYS